MLTHERTKCKKKFFVRSCQHKMEAKYFKVSKFRLINYSYQLYGLEVFSALCDSQMDQKQIAEQKL